MWGTVGKGVPIAGPYEVRRVGKWVEKGCTTWEWGTVQA